MPITLEISDNRHIATLIFFLFYRTVVFPNSLIGKTRIFSGFNADITELVENLFYVFQVPYNERVNLMHIARSLLFLLRS